MVGRVEPDPVGNGGGNRRFVDDDYDVGHRLRKVRSQQGITLSELSRLSGLTRSFLSQVEKGKVSPSVASLGRIASSLGITLGALFASPLNHDPVVRRENRPRLRYHGIGIEDELLSPTLTGKLEVLWVTVKPSGSTGEEPFSHDADEECVVVLNGALEITVDGTWYELRPGDAITFCSRLPHGYRNPLDQDTECLWIITPPGY
jgi:transcriptional regulator with XRE-family HTH domain